ncbi:MAG: hypothetical protein ACLPVY_00860 [Acidimicrobiia bacterium]
MTDMQSEHALAIVRAQLRRMPADALEAAVVLEASAGIPSDRALDLGRATVKVSRRAARGRGLFPAAAHRLAQSENDTVTERLVALLAFIGLLASLAAGAVSAWRAAMVVGFALQGLLFRRYITGQDRLGIIRRYPLGVAASVGAAATFAAVLDHNQMLAAALLVTWIGGIMVAERGWTSIYLALAAVVAIARLSGAVTTDLAAALAASTVVGLVVAAVATTAPSDLRPCSWPRGLFSAIVAGGFGLLIWLLPVTWEHLSPRVAAIPLVLALIGSTWAAGHLNELWDYAPRVFAETELHEDAAYTARAVMQQVFGGAAVRLCGTWVAALIVILSLSLFASFRPDLVDALELMMLLFAITALAVEAALLDTFQHPAAAFFAVSLAVVTTLTLDPLASRSIVIAIGTMVGIMFATSCLAWQLWRAPLVFVAQLA